MCFGKFFFGDTNYWDCAIVLGKALTELAYTSDANAVRVLQPAVEAFFLVDGSEKDEEKKK